ncbi:MAG: TlpA family protein disulfide reductase [Fimbriimonadaceae bacterium]|nr:TlpA family protein disulfide reductase [Fimbriimonadaceae bacterium]
MSNLPEVGQPFIDFVLGDFDSQAARGGKPILAFIWRTGCSTCRFAMPYYDRLVRAYPEAVIVGVSQDGLAETSAYCQENRIQMPQAIDMDLAVSRKYGCKTVPTYVLAGNDGIIRLCSEAWSMKYMEEMSQLLAAELGVPVQEIVSEADNVPSFKPG